MKPNILFIFSDQQHGRALGRVDPFFQTPAIDAFARDAVRFSATFCTTPQCSPSRSTLMTGLYPSKTGVLNNIGAVGGEPLRMPTLAPAMQQSGYATAYYGKWHLGNDPAAAVGWNDRQPLDDKLDDAKVTANTDAWLRRCARQPDRPFFAMASYNDPHDVYHFQRRPPRPEDADVPLPPCWHGEDLAAKPTAQLRFMTHDQGVVIHDEPEAAWRGYRAAYRDKVAAFDSHVARLLATLEETGLDENTVVVVTSDHGDMDAHHRLIFKGPFMYEQMVHVPLMIRLPRPQRTAGGRDVSELITNADMCPTLLDFAGVDPPACDGESLKPCVTDHGPPPQREFVVGQYHGKQQWCEPIRMIRTHRHKLNVYAAGDVELYDLHEDPHELRNRASDPASDAIRRELDARLQQWMADNDDPFPTLCPHRPRPAGTGAANNP
ncbi:MAG: sulfatase-like hydrolase/transferase [Phycisphaeraceae bacterium]